MKNTSPWITIAVGMSSSSCQCERDIDPTPGTNTSASSASDTSAGTSFASSEESTGAPFDATRWIGRYHYETVGLEFGERGTPLGSHMLVNFEILPDSTASMFYDDCAFDVPITIAYEWSPDEPGWIELYPGAGEPSLRLLAGENLESLRVHLVAPCRELELEVNGHIDPWLPFHPGKSCWFERCIVANIMRVDYCAGEEPPPCP